MTIDYPFILAKYYPNTQWTLNGDDYKNIIWLDETTKPSEEELQLHYQEYLIERERTKYRDERKSAYNERGADILSVVEALRESIIENRSEKLQAIQGIIEQVKIEFPKPEVKV